MMRNSKKRFSSVKNFNLQYNKKISAPKIFIVPWTVYLSKVREKIFDKVTKLSWMEHIKDDKTQNECNGNFVNSKAKREFVNAKHSYKCTFTFSKPIIKCTFISWHALAPRKSGRPVTNNWRISCQLLY